MLVFLRDIPAGTRHREISDFIKPALKKNRINPFSIPGLLEEIKMIGLQDNDRNTVEYHALLIVTPDPAAKRVIARLNEMPFKGRPTTVRQYIVRSIYNDPRVKSPIKRMVLKERRVGDRRRHNLKVIQNSSQRSIDKADGRFA